MRDKSGAFKRFIFAQHHILCLTIAGCLGVPFSALGCARHTVAGHHDTNVNYFRRLPQVCQVLHEVGPAQSRVKLILSSPIDQQNSCANQQRGDDNLGSDHLAIYEMSKQDRKDRGQKRKAGDRGRWIGGQQKKP